MNRPKTIAVSLGIGFFLSAIVNCQRADAAQRPAQPRAVQRYIQTVWTTEDGLPQNSVTAILQTRDGYLWLGTFGGLARFDGVKFTVFTAAHSSGLKDNRILALYEDRQGAVWIGTETGGASRYKQGTFTAFTIQHGLPDNRVTAFCEDRDGGLWIATYGGVARLHDGQFQTYTTADGLPINAAKDISADPHGTIWVGTSRGLARLENGAFIMYLKQDGLFDDQVSFIRAGRDASLWVGTEHGLTQLTNGVVSASVRVRLPRDVWQEADGSLWIASWDEGVLRWDGQTLAAFTNDSGLPTNKVRAIFKDREGTLWVGTSGGGLVGWKQKRVMSYTTQDGLANDDTYPIIEDREGAMWIGSIGGLTRLQKGTATLFGLAEGLSGAAVWSLCEDRAGTLWVGRLGQPSLCRLIGGKLTCFSETHGWEPAPVFSIYQDRQGMVWVGAGSNKGLARFDGSTFRFYRTADGLVDGEVRFITQAQDGAFWIGATNGLSRFKDETFTNYTTQDGLSHNSVRVVREDADGTLWIGTYGGGLNRFKQGRFFHYTTANGLFDDVVSWILEDDRGNFWMSGNRGIFRVSRKELNDFADGRTAAFTCIAYGVADGMPSSECNGGGQPGGWRSRDGRLWFPTIKGVVVIDPRQMNDLPPPVHVEQMLIDKTPMRLWQQIEAPPGHGDLEIHYTALSFVAPEKMRFRYRLEGYDHGWIEAGSRRVAYYTNVPPGQYQFRVLAMNNDGVWNETGAVVAFRLLPHFYQTRWFFLLIGAGLILIGWSGYRWRVQHLQRRTRQLEKKVAERTAEVVEQKEQLARANTQLERANENMLSIFNQWRSGVMTTDEQERITFLSQTGERLFDLSHTETLGAVWDHVVPLSPSDIARLKALVQRPPQLRSKLLLHVDSDAGQQYWMEIEVQDDPRDPRRKIFFLYDVSEIYDLRQLLDDKAKFHDLVGESAAMQLVYRQIRDLAKVDTTVLIQGETGTGKELVARAIHYFSSRKSRPFIAVNCAGLTESLVSSQLFGHKRGSFTGAVADQKGVFESAEGGTLFLDEIGDMPMSVQTNLLRVLQEREITRVGESVPRKIDVRVVAATHRNLDQSMAEGRFRQDLLYRLRVAEIHLPPLRERRRDIPLLVAWFLGQFRRDTETAPQEVSQEAMQKLINYEWPGNVRELKSAIEAAAIRSAGPVIQLEDLPAHISGSVAGPSAPADPLAERQQRVLDALARTGGNRAAAARLLGIGRTTLYLWMHELGIQSEKKKAE
ncbi:MAG: sigma 54-interacting transcriptional regulator [Acidobacteriota bacterium]|nr:sigma 54-interacting transcriptional regulator [Blastocatellia bacterium]MDW8241420.1 sigma 54-interacting transcriptional regulator [Acidobacteriota bacterium]